MPQFVPIPVEQKLHLGFQYINADGEIAGDKKCDYCGKWFTWTTKNRAKYIQEWNWNIQQGSLVHRKVGEEIIPIPNTINEEPIHCGSGHCQDYHMRVIKHEMKIASGDREYIKEHKRNLKDRKLKK